ncbi:Hypothetical protein SMAX5B_008729 [Scophthalmus maximus]|uniref:Uncharacterized protein n=1 Tax=Scophthalmus maximus TaxID=52904 RepID=A0A2U9CDM9_SCOMX|nr:Hypothetical protein SMAX5B_008729 [Scophthalmus maximus]
MAIQARPYEDGFGKSPVPITRVVKFESFWEIAERMRRSRPTGFLKSANQNEEDFR